MTKHGMIPITHFITMSLQVATTKKMVQESTMSVCTKLWYCSILGFHSSKDASCQDEHQCLGRAEEVSVYLTPC